MRARPAIQSGHPSAGHASAGRFRAVWTTRIVIVVLHMSVACARS